MQSFVVRFLRAFSRLRNLRVLQEKGIACVPQTLFTLKISFLRAFLRWLLKTDPKSKLHCLLLPLQFGCFNMKKLSTQLKSWWWLISSHQEPNEGSWSREVLWNQRLFGHELVKWPFTNSYHGYRCLQLGRYISYLLLCNKLSLTFSAYSSKHFVFPFLWVSSLSMAYFGNLGSSFLMRL